VVVGEPGHPDQFPYFDPWRDVVLSRPTWLKPHLEKACRIMVARVAAASKCREKCKKLEKPILAGDPEETSPPFVPLYPPLPFAPSPPPSEEEAALDREGPAANMPIMLGPGVLETATTPPSSGPMNLMLTPSPPVLTPQLPARQAPRSNQEHLNSPNTGLASPLGPTILQMSLRGPGPNIL
jgi:hypothetical protein